MIYPQASPLLTKQGVEVSARGDLVILRIGNTDLFMSYEQALDLSRWVRIEAREIKSGLGRGRTTRSLGVIHDCQARPRALPMQAGPAIHSRPRLETWHRNDIGSEGRLVRITVGPHTIRTHYENALKLAQWLRVRAKEAMRNAGDTQRHWSEVGSGEE